MRQLVLDTETTGLEPSQGHRLIEVAAVEMINRRLTGNYLHFYINPEREIDAGAQKVHGITNQFVQDKPVFHAIADELFAYLEGSELIIHNAPFDLSFLDHEFALLNKTQKKNFPKISESCSIIDTLVMARKRHRGQKNNLDALCKRYQVDNSRRDWHGALIDAELLSGVYLAMTGGQISLFDAAATSASETMTTPASNTMYVATDVPEGPFKIIYASEEELKAHEEYLSGLNSD
jgi:DNA polymerase-3 subunit epsilon